uniref:NADH-ubiquinone oxidoreductase chain 3 n=1 Tax=Histiostomatidae sp. XFX TaxID=2652661 RepID=A0A5J6VCM6_9ACAR|nr:NADH dehydrogenase subunit 3 [Histiostomatidae sp. XFX]
MKIIFFCFFCFFIVLLFLFLCYMISYSFFLSGKEPSSPFECGFSPLMNSMLLFSMPFFLISIMFLLFDVEILLLCFFPLFSYMGSLSSIFSLIVIIMVTFATLYEWVLGVISWM